MTWFRIVVECWLVGLRHHGFLSPHYLWVFPCKNLVLHCLSLYIWYYVWISKIRLICFNIISCRVIIKSLYLFLHIFWLKRLNILDWLVNWLLSLLGWLFLWLLLSLAFFNIYLVCDWFLIFIIYDGFFIFQVHEWFLIVWVHK